MEDTEVVPHSSKVEDMEASSSQTRETGQDLLSPMFMSLLRAAKAMPDLVLNDCWWRIIRDWYPDMQTKIYCVPPVHFNAVSYKQTDPMVTQQESYERFGYRMMIPTQCSCVRDDEAQQRVLYILSAYYRVKQRPAFILSNVEFQNYLSKNIAAENAVISRLPKVQNEEDEGEADFIVIDKCKGIFVFENKATGVRRAGLSEEEQLQELLRPLRKTSKQLTKNKHVLERLISDLNQDGKIKIRCGFILPNTSRDLLKKACDLHLHAAENLKTSAGVSTITDMLACCLCSDDLPPPNITGEETITIEIIQQLDRFFRALPPTTDTTEGMSCEVYEQIVARFCGPLTTVKIYTEKAMPKARVEQVFPKSTKRRRSKQPKAAKVRVVPFECRTVAGAAREMARRFSELVLLPEQIELLHQHDDFVHIKGPPGTGKTLMLLLRILTWLDGNNMVWVISLASPSFSVTHLLLDQAKLMLKEHKGHKAAEEIVDAKLHHFFLSRPESNRPDLYFEKKLHKWRLRAQGAPACEKVCLVVDESGFGGKDAADFFNQVAKCHRQGCFNKSDHGVGLSVWSASVERRGQPSYVRDPQSADDQFGVLMELSKPLRCPPSVQRTVMLVQPSLDLTDVCGFKEDSHLPQPAHSQYNSSGEGMIQPHADGMPVCLIAHGNHKKADQEIWYCRECADRLADYLQNELGLTDDSGGMSPDHPLTYKDVMIVATQAACRTFMDHGEFVRTLKQRGIEVVINRTRHEGDWPVPSTNVTLLVDFNSIHGLERAVIVAVPEYPQTPSAKECESVYVDMDHAQEGLLSSAGEPMEVEETSDPYDIDLECDGEVDDPEYMGLKGRTGRQSLVGTNDWTSAFHGAAPHTVTRGRHARFDRADGGVTVENTDITYSGSPTHRQIEAALQTLTEEARQDIFYIGSRAVSQLIIIHFGKDPK